MRIPHQPVEPPFWRPLFCHVLGVSPRLVRTLWRSVCASQSPTCHVWVWRLQAFAATVDQWDERALRQFVAHTWEPHTICGVIEALIAERRLNRAQGTELEEACFRHMHQGAWRS
jgi:hypothetical protein